MAVQVVTGKVVQGSARRHDYTMAVRSGKRAEKDGTSR